MSFQTAYGTNDDSSYPNSYQNSYQGNSSSNYGKDFSDLSKNKNDLQEMKKQVIQNLEEFSQGFVRLNEVADYLGSSRDTKDFRARLYVSILTLHMHIHVFCTLRFLIVSLSML